MGKYEFKKFKKGSKEFTLFAQKDGDNYVGPRVEHNTVSNATSIGVLSPDGQLQFELELSNDAGYEYTFRLLNKDGVPNGPVMLVAGGSLYFGKYYAKEGFKGIVYKFKNGENARTQLYSHGILADECLTDYIVADDVAVRLRSEANYFPTEVIEKKVKTGIEYIAGDPTLTAAPPILCSQVNDDGTVNIGLHKNGTFNGVVMSCSADGKTYQIRLYEEDKPLTDFEFIYNVVVKGYALIIKKDDGGYLDFVYRPEGDDYEMSITELNDRRKLMKETKVVLPNEIDPNAPKPGANIKLKHKPAKGKDGKTAEERLEALVGVQDAKEKVKLLKALFKKFKGDPAKVSLHMCFTGNPGTGKTEVARLIAEILYDNGILETKNCVEVDPSGLVAQYVGQTQPKTHDVVKKAMGGVLFIDEAYTLASGGFKASSGDDFGAEAIQALLQDMETYQGKFCVILAGYQKPMMDMIESNPGFKSRITNFIEFPNYSLPELKEIAKIFIKKDGYTITDDALEEVIKYVSTKSYREDFANAREVRNALQLLYTYQALRTIDDSDDLTITIDDVYAFLKKKDPKLESGKTAEERLNELIGLDSVKKELKGIEAVLIKNKSNPDKLNLNFGFLGNPGTGKTEVANLLADIFYDKGILPTRNFISTNRSGLVAGFTGQTALKTHKVFHDALGGVLFIDEAYNLYAGKQDEFGIEAITALLEDMEKYRGKICVVLAGYTKEIGQLVSSNPGFESRVNHWITFPDYSTEELKKIFELIVSKQNYSIEPKALEEALKIVELDREYANFANARSVRNLLEALIQIQAIRTIDSQGDTLITIEDVKTYEKDHNVTFKKKAKKTDWNISYGSIRKLSSAWNDSWFSYTNAYVEESSVNIKIIKDGKEAGEGSGFFISPDGFIATNHHVAGDADEMVVIVNLKTSKGQTIQKEYAAELVASDKENDVAIIGILNPDVKFQYYPLARDNDQYPELLTTVVMGGYPFGGDRFANVTLLEGKVQSINKDAYSQADTDFIYLDLLGQPGSSGSGVIDKATGRAIAVFKGAAINSNDPSLKIRMSIPVKYLWNLLKSLKSSENEHIDDFEDHPLDNYHQDRDDFYERDRNRRDLDEYDRDINPYEHIHLVEDNIALFEGDAVVNAANSRLAPGGGVCGAIYDAAGYGKLKEACYKIGHCDPGHSVITPGFDLKAKYIIHTVGPQYKIDPNPKGLLRMAYETAFILAMENRCETIAFPSLSTGHYGYPPEEAVPIALDMISIYAGRQVREVYIYVKGDTAELYKKELEKRKFRRD